MKFTALAAVVLMAATGAVQAEEKLVVYNWSEYIPEGVLDDFTRETGIEVEYSTYENNEVMYSKLKLQKGNFVVVPIPISNPTLDSGLVVGGAYFYPQTDEEKKSQPASLTALGGLYTSNDSRAVVIAQQNYWKDDR